jgi:hypothetical protein
MQDEVTLHMPARSMQEDVIDFVERMQRDIGVDHRKRSPLCMATKLEYAKIPLDKDVDRVGDVSGGTA